MQALYQLSYVPWQPDNRSESGLRRRMGVGLPTALSLQPARAKAGNEL